MKTQTYFVAYILLPEPFTEEEKAHGHGIIRRSPEKPVTMKDILDEIAIKNGVNSKLIILTALNVLPENFAKPI